MAQTQEKRLYTLTLTANQLFLLMARFTGHPIAMLIPEVMASKEEFQQLDKQLGLLGNEALKELQERKNA